MASCEILGLPGPKKFLDALENDTKGNFQENILGKIQYQKKSVECHWPPTFTPC